MEDLKLMTHGELMFLGLQKLAYVKTTKENGSDVFSIYAADGTELATVNNAAEAQALISKNDMRSVTLH